MNGKGDKYRPFDKDKFSEGYDLIFNSKPVVEEIQLDLLEDLEEEESK